MTILALDIGGTKIEAALLKFADDKKSYQVLGCQRMATQRHRSYSDIVAAMTVFVQNLLDSVSIKAETISALGIGMPGTVDPLRQVMIQGNSQVFEGQAIAIDFCRGLKIAVPSVVANDANCFALAEAHFGAGTQVTSPNQIVVGIILGTGVGAGIIINRQILQGRLGAAGEWGHTTLYDHGLVCYCGRQGCAEQYLSGKAIEKFYHLQTKNHPSARDACEIFERGNQQEPLAVQVLDNYRGNLAQFLLQITNALSPDLIVLGGGVSNQEYIYKDLHSEVSRQCFLRGEGPLICRHGIGDSAGVIGAGLLASALGSNLI